MPAFSFLLCHVVLSVMSHHLVMPTRVGPPVCVSIVVSPQSFLISVSIHLAMPTRVGPSDGEATFRPTCRYAISLGSDTLARCPCILPVPSRHLQVAQAFPRSSFRAHFSSSSQFLNGRGHHGFPVSRFRIMAIRGVGFTSGTSIFLGGMAIGRWIVTSGT